MKTDRPLTLPLCVCRPLSDFTVPKSSTVCVSSDVCQGGALRGGRDLYKSANPTRQLCMCDRVEWSSTWECVCVCVSVGLVLTRLWVHLRGRAVRCWVELREQSRTICKRSSDGARTVEQDSSHWRHGWGWVLKHPEFLFHFSSWVKCNESTHRKQTRRDTSCAAAAVSAC